MFFVSKISFFSNPYPLVLRESKMYGNFIVKLCKALDHHFNESTHSLPFSGLCSVLITFFRLFAVNYFKRERENDGNKRKKLEISHPKFPFQFSFIALQLFAINLWNHSCGKKNIVPLKSQYAILSTLKNLCSKNCSNWFLNKSKNSHE